MIKKMAIEIKEYVGHKFVTVPKSQTNDIKSLSEGYVETYVDEDSLMVEIEAIHSRITRNNTFYSPECLKHSVPYWTNPYEIPVIYHHKEKDGITIGRIKASHYVESGTRIDTPALNLTANIGDEEGKKGILNGTLSTVSIGVIAHDLRCSICNQNLAEEGMCEHEKGEYYDEQLCYWIINKMEPKEVSYVIVPSDIYAHNVKVTKAVNKKKSEVKESMENNIFDDLIKSTKSMIESASTTEGTQVDEEVKKGTESKEPEAPKEPEIPENEDNKDKAPENKEPENEKPDSKEGEKPKEPETEEPKKSEDEGEKSTEPKTNEDDEKPVDNEELETAKAKIEELSKEVERLIAENNKLVKRADNEKKLKEAAEGMLVTYRAKEKKSLIENINNLKSKLNLPLEDESMLMESSEDVLKANLKQLNEFTQVQKNVFGMQTLTSPIAVSESKDNGSKENNEVKDVKESSEHSNKSMEQEYIELMKNIF